MAIIHGVCKIQSQYIYINKYEHFTTHLVHYSLHITVDMEKLKSNYTQGVAFLKRAWNMFWGLYKGHLFWQSPHLWDLMWNRCWFYGGIYCTLNPAHNLFKFKNIFIIYRLKWRRNRPPLKWKRKWKRRRRRRKRLTEKRSRMTLQVLSPNMDLAFSLHVVLILFCVISVSLRSWNCSWISKARNFCCRLGLLCMCSLYWVL